MLIIIIIKQLKQTFALGKPAVGTLNPQERLFVVIIIPVFAIIIIALGHGDNNTSKTDVAPWCYKWV